MSELTKVQRAELAGPRSGARQVLTEPVHRGELRMRIEGMTSHASLTGATLALLEVRHLGSRVPVTRLAYAKDDEKNSAHALTERIAALVESDARQMPGAYQNYAVEAYYGDAHFPGEQARVRVRWDDDDDAAQSSAPAGLGSSEAKLISKAFVAMTDATVRLTKGQSVETREVMRMLQEHNRELTEQVRSLQADLTAQAKAHQAALNEQHDRELKTERQRELIATFRRISGVAEALLPVFLSKKFGIDMPLPPQANPIIESFRQLYERVTADEKTMLAVMQALSHDEAALVLFGNLMSVLQDRRDLETARASMTVAAQAGKLTEGSAGGAP